MIESLPWNLPLSRLLAELGATRSGLTADDVERGVSLDTVRTTRLPIAADRCGANFSIVSPIL
jgi:hypothetical protein